MVGTIMSTIVGQENATLPEVTVKARVKLYRERAGLSRAELAAKARVSEGAIEAIEGGKTKEPSFTTGLLIAHALGVSAWELNFGEPEPGVLSPAEEATALKRISSVEQQLLRIQALLDRLFPEEPGSDDQPLA